MSNQEMQFADPDWKPSQKLDTKTGTQEQETFIPEPINADSRERWNTTPPPPPRQEMYTGLPPYYAGATPQQPIRGQYRGGSYRRGGRGIWFWVILAFIIISLMGGGFGSVFNRSGESTGFSGPQFSGPQSSIPEKAQSFNVGSQPTIVINDDNGAVNVQSSGNTGSVIIQDTKYPGSFGAPNNSQVNYNQSQDGNTIDVSVSNGGQTDINVTVPQNTNLQLKTSSGDITIDGVTLSGNSTITTDSGTISFNGTIGTSGTDQFTTSSGIIDLSVSPDSAFHLKASTNSGTISTPGFPSVTLQTNNQGQGSTQAAGNVGTASQGQGATVTLTTDSGDINLQQGQ